MCFQEMCFEVWLDLHKFGISKLVAAICFRICNTIAGFRNTVSYVSSSNKQGRIVCFLLI